MTKDLPRWLISFGAMLWIGNELFKLWKNVKGKTPEPANEVLGASSKSVSRRVHVVEGSISKIYGLLAEMKDDNSTKFSELKAELAATSERRTEKINEQFKEIAAAIARLDERTK